MINEDIKNKIKTSFYANIHAFQRLFAIVEDLRPFIYDKNGEYIEGGQEVYNYICEVESKAYELEHKEPDYSGIF